MSQIFLSYNREDQAVAKRFAEAFEREGLSIWWDTALRSGEAYDEVTEAALRGAKAVVVLWSPRSVVSRWVRAEATIADRCSTLVPVTIEPCERPIMFELTQTSDLSRWTGDAGDKAWRKFLGHLRAQLGRGRQEQAAEPHTDHAVPELPPARPGKRGEAPSLAVLPFTNRSHLPEDEVFAEGMVEDLIDALSHGVNIQVLSSSSTARFRTGAMPDVEAMGRQLGVKYLLEGNVRRSASNLRVTAQLVAAEGGEIVWTQRFDRPLADLAALQEELIEEVAAHLGTQVYRMAMEQALKKPSDLTAWECVMRALAAMRRLSGETLGLAIQEATHAVAIAPDYGLAQALMAHSSSLAYMFLSPDNAAEAKRIRFHIDRALACDGESAAVLAHVAFALMYTGQAQEALTSALRSIEINPGYGFGKLAAGIASPMLGQPEAALAHLADFRRIEPQSPYLHYALNWEAVAHLALGDWAAAEGNFAASFALNPLAGYTCWYQALVSAHFGRNVEAHRQMVETRRREPTATRELWELRLKLWGANSPATDELRTHLHALWAETEALA